MASLFRRKRIPPRPDEQRLFNGYSQPPGWVIRNALPSLETPTIDPETALNGTIAVYACVSLLADLVGSLPLKLYRRREEGRERITFQSDRTYPGSLARMVGSVPNPEMTAQELWTNVVGHLALWGNAYCEVMRDGSGRPKELWPLRPDRVRIERDKETGRLAYFYMPLIGGEIPVGEVMHVRAFGTDGVMGMSPITAARKTIGAEQSAQAFAQNWYLNGATPSAVVTIPRGPKETFKERTGVFRDAIGALYGGPRNAGRVAVIEDNTTWQTVSLSQKDMEFIETRKFTIGEIARLYRIPPHLVGDVERSTSWGSGIEQQNLGFLTYTLRPILSRIEHAIGRDLGLVPGERTLLDEGLYAEFLTADLLRTDLKTRFEAHAIAIQNRWQTPAQVAQLENLPFDPSRPSDYANPNVDTGQEGRSELSLEELTLALQKIYLAVGVVISPEEARELLNRYGANLSAALPEGVGPRKPQQLSLTDDGESEA